MSAQQFLILVLACVVVIGGYVVMRSQLRRLKWVKEVDARSRERFEQQYLD